MRYGVVELSLRTLLSAIFVLSSAGKLLDPSAASLQVVEILPLSPSLARAAVYLLCMVELGMVTFLWRRRFPLVLIALPLSFAAVLAWSFVENRECGCFGSLPVLSNLPFIGHALLLAGMLLGFLALHRSGKPSGSSTGSMPVLQGAFPHSLGAVSLVLLMLSLLTLPLASQTGQGLQTSGPGVATLEEVRQALGKKDVVLIDARTPFEYDIGHIPGAINIPHDSDSLETLYRQNQLDMVSLIVYCAGPDCNKAELLAERLRQLGHRDVRVFPGGWDAWVNAESVLNW